MEDRAPSPSTLPISLSISRLCRSHLSVSILLSALNSHSLFLFSLSLSRSDCARAEEQEERRKKKKIIKKRKEEPGMRIEERSRFL
jgi:hypothetical protein